MLVSHSSRETRTTSKKTKNINYCTLGARYNTEEVGSRQQRLDVRARASLQALTRGDSGCAMSPVEMARAMTALLRLHQSEVEMQVFFFSLGLSVQQQCPSLVFNVQATLKYELRMYMEQSAKVRMI